MEIRPARPTDDMGLVSLIYSAGPELYDFIYKTDRHDARDYIAYEFQSGRGFCGHHNVTVAVRDGAVIGTGCFYGARQYGRLTLGTAINMFKFYGPIHIWPVLARSGHIGSVMKKPKKSELYLSNFGVAASQRSTGVGSTMINTKVAEARQQGYGVFGLDVADTNPRAEKLYRKLGLQMIEFKKFSGRRQGMQIPNSKKLELPLHP